LFLRICLVECIGGIRIALRHRSRRHSFFDQLLAFIDCVPGGRPRRGEQALIIPKAAMLDNDRDNSPRVRRHRLFPRAPGDEAFCSGGEQGGRRRRLLRARHEWPAVEELQSTIRNIPKPVIARVDSYAIGRSGNALREKRKPGLRKYANK
jgi:hypothetical protein